MEGNYSSTIGDSQLRNDDLQIVRYVPFHLRSIRNKSPSLWFDISVFYVRVSNLLVDDSTPDFLNVSYSSLNPGTLLEVNGVRDVAKSCTLRRDRFDRKSDETTFVCTDRVRTTGSVKYEIFGRDEIILSGVLETSESCSNKWSMSCESVKAARFLRGKQIISEPSFDVYVTGTFAGSPVLLSKTLQIRRRKRKTALNADWEDDAKDLRGNEEVGYEMEKGEEMGEEEYWRGMEYMDEEEEEASWFNAGVRVGVGIGLGICVGIGIGVGLILQSYQTTSRTFKRRFL